MADCYRSPPSKNPGSAPYVNLHLRDRREAASFRYRNRAEITVLKCEQKSYPVWFLCLRKIYPA